ncbi:glycoside hydrolase superfamily [Lactifluus volemus]|nr:glycoside hydrolase superfamily [Lactifluus volemus]
MLPRPFKPFYVIFVVLPLTNALWPQSRHLQTGPPSSVLCLAPSNSFTISVDEVPNTPKDPIAAAQRTHIQLFSDDLDDFEAISESDGVPTLRRLVLRLDDYHAYTQTNTNTGSLGTFGSTVGDDVVVVQPIEMEARMFLGTCDEGYSLVVPGDGSHAVLKANWILGLFRGLNTFRLMMPTYPVSDIERTLDAMSWVHINTFHWHVVDSQNFPLVLSGFTDIAEKAAYSADAVYTPQDVSHIVSYAGQPQWGIDVLVVRGIPRLGTKGKEVNVHNRKWTRPDIPRSSAISKAYLEHIACADAKPWRTLLSAAAKLFPSTLFATGGDEINTRCYQDDPRSLRKTPVMWQEMVLNFNLTLSNDTIALVWISSEDAAAVAAKGFRFIPAVVLSGLWCRRWVGRLSYRQQLAYTFNLLANLTSEQVSLVLGGQHLLWTEQSGPENLDPIAWPRAAASAEVFWTGPGGNDSAALPRLHELGYRFRRRGVNVI